MDRLDQTLMEELEARVLADSFLIGHLLADASPGALEAISVAADEYQPRLLGSALPEERLAVIRRMIKWAVQGVPDRKELGPQG